MKRFESNHNSVVVSVGNTGEDQQKIHPEVKLPADFHKSYNINDEVTAVGSSMRGIGRAGYSAPERNNIIYTEGMAPGNNLPPSAAATPKWIRRRPVNFWPRAKFLTSAG